ncbi:MAG: MBL fold metallo-hydrolase [Gemmatimonadota bacterium]
MRFRLLAHASLWIEHAGTSVLVDPWLTGSCYQDAWRQVPEQPDLVAQLERPSFVLFSHAHPDHLHAETLRALLARFGPDVPAIVPRMVVTHVASALRELGFRDVREVPLLRPLPLGTDFTLSIHAARADDSAHIFKVGGRTLVNFNDCQFEGATLAALVKAAGKSDFCFGQFAPADGYPFRLEDFPEQAALSAAAAPLEQFRRVAAALDAEWAVPTASLIRFSHTDNVGMNRRLVTLDETLPPEGTGPPTAVLFPGDGWSEANGFEREPAHRERYRDAVASVREGRAPLAVREPVPALEILKRTAEQRFEDMFRRIPFLMRRRMGKIAFVLDDADLSLVIDWRARTLRWGAAASDLPHYSLGAGLFLEACRVPWGWGDLHIGCRFTVHRWQGNSAVESFLPSSILYGLGYFDGVGQFFRPQALGAAWARRVEIAELIRKAFTRATWRGDDFQRL